MPFSIENMFMNAFIVFRERISDPKTSKQHTTNELTDDQAKFKKRFFDGELEEGSEDKIIFVHIYTRIA